MRKKIISVLLIALLLLSSMVFAACSKKTDEDTTDETSIDVSEDVDVSEEEDFDLDNLDLTLSGEVRVNDSVKMYLKEIGKYDLLKPEDEPILAQKMQEDNFLERERIFVAIENEQIIGFCTFTKED